MKRRKIDPETKTAAVLERLRGERSIADICRKYQIRESFRPAWDAWRGWGAPKGSRKTT
jgi:transposase